MKCRPMCVAFAALVVALTVATARDAVHASDLEPGAGFTVKAGAPPAGEAPDLDAPAPPVTAPDLDGMNGALASHFERKGAAGPDSEPVYASRYYPRPLPPNHPPIGPPPSESHYQPSVPYQPAVSERKPYPRGFGQLHFGGMDPEGPLGPAFMLGFRAGSQISSMLQLGIGVDWRHKTGQDAQVVQQGVGPGGEPITLYRDLSRYSSDLLPAMVYAQLSLPASLPICPYFGAGAGWQVLYLSADDYQNGSSFDATYDGFGWQMWGGAGLRLSGHTRLFGEAFYNEADVNRNVYDYTLDANFRESIHEQSVGVRGGLSWGF